MKTILQRTVNNETETKKIVTEFIQILEKLENFSVFFKGGLGVGKTFFVRELLKQFGVNETVNSPTYTYVQEYSGLKNFAHFDLYRLNSNEEFLAKGFGEIIEDNTICKLVEWPNKISSEILEEFSGEKFWVEISHGKNEIERVIEIKSS